MAALDEVTVGINVGNGLDGLQQNSVVKMHAEMCATAHYSVQDIIHQT
jgi:hypothetical protein